MSDANVVINAISGPWATVPDLEQLRDRVASFRRHAKADRTAQTYRNQWRAFEAWCGEVGFATDPGDPDVVGVYLAGLAERGLRAASILVAWAAIRAHYRRVGGDGGVLESRALRELVEGIVRVLPKEQRQAKALTADYLRRVVDAARSAGDTPLIQRDVALLLLGFAAALRRVELTFLGRGDFIVNCDTAAIRLVRSKASQSKPVLLSIGRAADSRYCPIAAVEAWLRVAPPSPFLFCGFATRLGSGRVSYKTLGKILVARLEAAGIDSDGFSSHSLRSGMITSLNLAGVPTAAVQHHSRHSSADLVTRYHRPGGHLGVNYTKAVGL